MTEDGEVKPTRKGVTLNRNEWENLIASLSEISAVLPEMALVTSCLQRDDHQNQDGALRCLILTLSLSLSIEVSLLLSQQTKDPAEEMDYVSQDTNATLCTYFKQFKLSGSKRISVCAYNQHVRVDIRRFIDDKATIQGIWINSEEWLALIRLQGKINLSMTFAKNN